jgi:hemerythrin-like domain-containing protein
MPIHIGQRPDHGFEEPLGLLSDCHRRIEHFLRVLLAIDHQASGGPLTPGQRADLEAALTYFATAAPRHTADEEESLFPRLRESSDPAAARALEIVAGLERDHDTAGRHHASVDALARRWMARGGLDAVDARALRGHLESLQATYGQHIDVEDRELFPSAAQLLSPSQMREIGREMSARRASPARTPPQSAGTILLP